MQLIVESEPSIAVEKNMATIDDINSEKVGNGNIGEIDKNCNGNKENIGDINVITNDDVNKQVTNEGDNTLANVQIDIKLENKDVKSNVETNEKDTTEESIGDANNAQVEGSQNSGIDEKINETDNDNLEVTAQQDVEMQDVDDIVNIKEENMNQIVDIVEKESDKTVVEKDVENVAEASDDVENVVSENGVMEKVDTEVVENIILESEVTKNEIAENDDVGNVDAGKHMESNGGENIVAETDSADIPLPESDGEKNDVAVNFVSNNSAENIAEDDGMVLERKSLNIKDDVEVVEESAESPTNCESTTDLFLDAESSESNKDEKVSDSQNLIEKLECDSADIVLNNAQDSPIELKDDMDVEEVIEETQKNKQDSSSDKKDTAPVNTIIDKPIICKLSNTLDILSDDEEEPPKEEQPKVVDSSDKQCIDIEDDDDIMLIDEDASKTETPKTVDTSNKEESSTDVNVKTDSETGEKTVEENDDLFKKEEVKETTPAESKDASPQINEKQEEPEINKTAPEIPLLPEQFLKTAKKNISDMTREDLEEFCIVKIVESIVDRSNLSEIKNKLKAMAQGIEEYRKKAMMLTKQNRDLQVVLKSIQEEQKKMSPDAPITPLKITRSVGMQVFMEKPGARRKSLAQLNNTNNSNVVNRPNVRNVQAQSPRPQKPANAQPIPVPRLVPASPAMKSPNNVPQVNQVPANKTATPMPNGIKNPSPQKVAEKRQHNRIMSVTVDLTDDEPPTKMNNRTSPAPPVRLVSPQNLMATPRQAFTSAVNSPRKVYIPISGPQNPGIRPGQTIMLKTVPTPGLRQRGPTPQVARMPSGAVRMNRIQTGRHPAPLPDAMKQYQPPNWKALPPAPDLKLSKVENGIVISWKIEGYLEDSYEEIASYQLYAYQETSSPPSTALWKKIGDVKALPLPMACTLTQFMAGFKYYFAVRAVDIRSRLGPFSLPGSILLLNKL